MKTLSSILFAGAVILGATQPASADGPKLSDEKWSCPASVTINGKSHKLLYEGVFDGPPEKRVQLAPERRFDAFRHLERMDIYLTCEYKSLRYRLMIHAKGATTCGSKGKAPLTCWVGN